MYPQMADRGYGDLPSKSASETGGTPDLACYRARLRLFAARRLGDWGAAEDVTQEALRRTLEALRAGKVENTAALYAFLSQTTLNICLERSRSAGRENRALRRFAASPRAAAADPLSDLITEERRAEVRQALERLDEEDREVLRLTYSEALRSAEIGRRLNLTEGNVRVRRHRALKRLADLLGVTKSPLRPPK